MTFYIQHGYGKGQKMQDVLNDGHLSGAILSPGDEESATLTATAKGLFEKGIDVLVDPQTYLYSTRPPGRGRNHDSHGIEFRGLSWAQDAQSIASHVEQIGHLNASINADGRWIAPGPLQASFSDIWTPLSVQFARTASQAWGATRTIATVAVDEAGLADWHALERWLDAATTLPVRGFYLLVSRPSTVYPATPWDPIKLVNLLRLIHVLAELNEFEVIWGYSDFEGLLGLAAGATSMATGWSYTLRQFSSAKWISPPSGGRAPAVRTHLRRLWATPRAEAETAILFASDQRAAVFSPDEIEFFERTPFEVINRVSAQVDHMNALATRADWLSRQQSVATRVSEVSASLERAIALWDSVRSSGLVPDPTYRSRVVAWRDSLVRFADAADL